MDTQQIAEGLNEDIRLGEVWDRMDDVCRKLWAEDRVSAVSLQAVLEEFRGEVARAQQCLASYHKSIFEMRKTVQQEISVSYREQIATLEQRLAEAREHGASQERALKAERERAEQLAKAVEVQEAQNLEFKEKFLKSEMERDVARGQKMEAFYKEVLEKSKGLEASWEDRQRELEAKYAAEEEELRKKNAGHLEAVRKLAMDLEKTFSEKELELASSYDRLKQELEARESRLVRREEELRQKEEGLAAKGAELEHSVQEKRRELDDLKARLQEEVATLAKRGKAN